MAKRCLVCGSDHQKTIYHDTLVKCEPCGFVTTNIEVDEGTLKNIYSVSYFKGEEYADYPSDKKVIVSNFKLRISRIRKLFPSHSMTNILEIGCAYGFFAEEIIRQFPLAFYQGYDVSEEACNFACKELHLNIKCLDFLTDEIIRPYSDVFMWDVIEHLSHPEKYIEKISRNILPGGKFFITTGDIGALVPRIMKSRWRLIHPPSHLHYFTRNSLFCLLEKNGFIIKDISYPGTSRSLKQIFYSLFLLHRKGSRLTHFLYRNIPEWWQITINTGDIMFLMAEKKVNNER